MPKEPSLGLNLDTPPDRETLEGLKTKIRELEQRIHGLEKELEEQKSIAERDPLTHLLNRRGLERRLGGILEGVIPKGRRGREIRGVGVIYLDADWLKKINDEHSHKEGDRLLITVARALASTLREGDVIARAGRGADEFVAVLVDVPKEEIVEKRGREIYQKVAAEDFGQGKEVIRGGVSMGCVFFAREDLLKLKRRWQIGEDIISLFTAEAERKMREDKKRRKRERN